MQTEKKNTERSAAAPAPQAQRAPQVPRHERLAAWTQRVWRPAGTAVVVLLALLMTWHVIYGKHGLSVWHQMRQQDRQLEQQIDQLRQENADMQQQIQQLQSDPDAIERAAREKLHYAKPGEVIYTLPATPPAGK